MASKIKGLGGRDLVGQDVVDYDERVDVARLRRERVEKLQAEIAKADLGGLLLADPLNVRYATGTRHTQVIKMRAMGRHVIVPREGAPVFFGGGGTDPPVASGEFPNKPFTTCQFWLTGDFHEQVTRRWSQSITDALTELGIAKERLGVDRLDTLGFLTLLSEGVKIVDGVKVVAMARNIKTQDELALIRQACAIADVALCEVREAIQPGVTENELFAVMTYTNLRYGGEHQDCRLITAGGNTTPWTHREASDRIVRPGDLVAIDTDMAGPLGYFADISRTYLCGDGKPNAEQLEAYKLAYDFIQQSLPLFKPGVSFQELAEGIPPIPDAYKANRYGLVAHGVGMADEWPAIHFLENSFIGFGNYAGEFKENMVMTMEASFGREDGQDQVKLEEQLIITADGPEVISRAPFDWRLLP